MIEKTYIPAAAMVVIVSVLLLDFFLLLLAMHYWNRVSRPKSLRQKVVELALATLADNSPDSSDKLKLAADRVTRLFRSAETRYPSIRRQYQSVVQLLEEAEFEMLPPSQEASPIDAAPNQASHNSNLGQIVAIRRYLSSEHPYMGFPDDVAFTLRRLDSTAGKRAREDLEILKMILSDSEMKIRHLERVTLQARYSFLGLAVTLFFGLISVVLFISG